MRCRSVFLVMAIFVSVSPSFCQSTSEERYFAELTNAERKQLGISLLAFDDNLSDIARAHCVEMESLHYFGHLSPYWRNFSPIDRYLNGTNDPLGCGRIGENLLYSNILKDPQSQHQAFMQSHDHRMNIIFPGYRKIGVGILHDSGQVWITVMFLG